jgi:predicted P-loop ATPase
MHVSLRAEIAEKIAKQQQLTYTMGLKLYWSHVKRKLNLRICLLPAKRVKITTSFERQI